MSYAKDMPTESARLAQAVARLNRRLRQERQSELSPTHLAVLGTVRKLGPATPTQIAARERVQPPSITRSLNCLAERGLITREPDPGDRRQVVVTISDLGEKTLADERDRRDAWLESRLAALDPAERATIAAATDLLDRLAGCE